MPLKKSLSLESNNCSNKPSLDVPSEEDQQEEASISRCRRSRRAAELSLSSFCPTWRTIQYHHSPRPYLTTTTTTTTTARSIIIMSFLKIIQQWKGAREFYWAQLQMVVVLLIAYIGNYWPNSYPRNDNHNPTIFWVMMTLLGLAAVASMKHEPTTRNIQLLSRAQTEEWKGWMQFAFVMYHYYRVYYVYNEIRVFVSAYVWMTGFGNFLYFDKKQDFSLERAISMWLRINYFPLLLSFAINVSLELYYVVPLHTAGFFITMFTCYLAKCLEYVMPSASSWKRNAVAIAVCFAVHIVFYETELKSCLKIFSDEYYFRFQVDKYSAVIGILSGFCWGKFKEYMNWCYGSPASETTQRQIQCMWYQRAAGVALIAVWWYLFGYMPDKRDYNPIHPFIFWMPVAGYLMLRNSSKYLTEIHSQALEFTGRITLETYVLQFHVLMCNKVQNIPIVIPGSGADGDPMLKFLNMLLCGVGFMALAYWARQITITTQNTVTDLLAQLCGHARGDNVQGGSPTKEAAGGGGEGGDVSMAPLKANDTFERKTSDDLSIMAAQPNSTGAPHVASA